MLALGREINPAHRVALLNYRAWLLKTVALELHTTALGEHRTSNNALLTLLFGNTVPEAGGMILRSGWYYECTLTVNDTDERVDEFDEYHMLPQARMKMRELLDGESISNVNALT